MKIEKKRKKKKRKASNIGWASYDETAICMLLLIV